MPLIIAYHVVFSAYGFWLPNDPRGSWSDAVWAKRLRRFGPPIPAATWRSLAAKPHNSQLRRAAKAELKYPPVRLTGVQARAVARGIADIAGEFHLPIFAAAIMPDHVHLVIPRQSQKAEEWVGFFKRAASRKLREENLHPLAGRVDAKGRLPTPWGEGGWKVYLHDAREIRQAIRYVQRNPERAGLPAQNWWFVTPY